MPVAEMAAGPASNNGEGLSPFKCLFAGHLFGPHATACNFIPIEISDGLPSAKREADLKAAALGHGLVFDEPDFLPWPPWSR